MIKLKLSQLVEISGGLAHIQKYPNGIGVSLSDFNGIPAPIVVFNGLKLTIFGCFFNDVPVNATSIYSGYKVETYKVATPDEQYKSAIYSLMLT
jgi:hypothetical protein